MAKRAIHSVGSGAYPLLGTLIAGAVLSLVSIVTV